MAKDFCIILPLCTILPNLVTLHKRRRKCVRASDAQNLEVTHSRLGHPFCDSTSGLHIWALLPWSSLVPRMRWRSILVQVVSCCVYDKQKRTMQQMYGNIQCLFDIFYEKAPWFIRRRWRSILVQVVSCCVYDKQKRIMQHKYGNIQNFFDFWANPFVHLLLLKSSML